MGGYTWLDEQRITAISMAINALEKEEDDYSSDDLRNAISTSLRTGGILALSCLKTSFVETNIKSINSDQFIMMVDNAIEVIQNYDKTKKGE